MDFNRKYLAIITLVVILAVINVTLAVLYMTKNVDISGGVQTVGSIEAYDEDGVTPLTSYDFSLFTPGGAGVLTKTFFINNTGSVDLYVKWNISSSSIVWTGDLAGEGYEHIEDTDVKYTFFMYKGDETVNIWRPDAPFTTPNYRSVEVGIGRTVTMELTYSGVPATGETFTLVISLYAIDPV